jgi:alpha-N-arabinofuranosidase
VNVIAPIMTNEDGILRQTIYYPYAWALKYAHGASLSVEQEGPGYPVPHLGRPIEDMGLPVPGFGEVPWLDVTAVWNEEKKTATLFALNRDLHNEREMEIVWRDLTPATVTTFETMTGPDLKALNTFADPKKVVPQTLDKPKTGSRMTVKLPARSYSVLSMTV